MISKVGCTWLNLLIEADTLVRRDNVGIMFIMISRFIEIHSTSLSSIVLFLPERKIWKSFTYIQLCIVKTQIDDHWDFLLGIALIQGVDLFFKQ